MKRALLTSTLLASALLGESIKIDKILIEDSEIKDTKRVSTKEIKFTRQSDLAEILSETLPEITLVRSSGVGSDIILRGFERDNLNILIDGAKVHGACPNRMDPPAMHISSNQIKEIKVNEGPFDVANFGGIGGLIEVNTKEPREEFAGELSAHIGSFEYSKASLNVEGGNDKLKLLVGYSREESAQYEDGDGNTISEQVAKILLTHPRLMARSASMIKRHLPGIEKALDGGNVEMTPLQLVEVRSLLFDVARFGGPELKGYIESVQEVLRSAKALAPLGIKVVGRIKAAPGLRKDNLATTWGAIRRTY